MRDRGRREARNLERAERAFRSAPDDPGAQRMWLRALMDSWASLSGETSANMFAFEVSHWPWFRKALDRFGLEAAAAIGRVFPAMPKKYRRKWLQSSPSAEHFATISAHFGGRSWLPDAERNWPVLYLKPGHATFAPAQGWPDGDDPLVIDPDPEQEAGDCFQAILLPDPAEDGQDEYEVCGRRAMALIDRNGRPVRMCKRCATDQMFRREGKETAEKLATMVRVLAEDAMDETFPHDEPWEASDSPYDLANKTWEWDFVNGVVKAPVVLTTRWTPTLLRIVLGLA